MRCDHKRLMKLLVGAWSLVLSVGVTGLPEEQQATGGAGTVARRVQTRADGGAIVASVSPDGRLFVFADWTGSVPGDISVQDLDSGDYRRLTNLGGYNAGSSSISPDSRHVAYAWRNADRVYDLHLIGVDGSNPRVLHADKQFHIFPADWSADGAHILAELSRKDRSNQIALIAVTDGSVRILKSLDSRSPGGLTFSPDSRFVAYDLPTRSNAAARDIFLLRMDTLHEVPLVEGPTNDVVLGWALDGRRVLFGRHREGTMDAWALPVAEGRLAGAPTVVMRDLGQIAPLRFTKEGAFLYVRQKGTRHVHLLELDTATGLLAGPLRRVGDQSDNPTFGPAWSPDGEELAYFSTPGAYDTGPGARTIIIRSSKTSDERVLSPKLDYPEGHPHQLRWSRDGRSLLTVSNDPQGLWSFYVVSVQTGEATILVRGRPGEILTAPAWSPDGRVLFYVHHDLAAQLSRIVAREIASGRVKDLYRAPLSVLPLRSGRDETMVLSPDGQHVAFSVAAQPPQSAVLMLLPASGGAPRELLRGQDIQVQGWTPDGRVLFTGRPNGSADGWLWSVATDGAALRLMLGPSNMQEYPRPGQFGISVHPNGREIAFTAGVIAQDEVWVIEKFPPVMSSGR